ncbi:TetR/AcrR family transcriptional regulator [Cognatiyoonia sp. IB215182]|uniref:TetR/AcrR family transcriptional regulator n=1 Tax=Cognatiyoonia sp. IB215182 TaxID=3097353 RepID=UPI002A0DE159|nr:TetR family transcriptional regulator C-terminal domain-containing protein [Cognatiyoonia sp. IB215182]MDX8355343.1 TetR family transcriptional regulator C-terminal domain-containing protein [Cognatiyoonia sp. IB215182]
MSKRSVEQLLNFEVIVKGTDVKRLSGEERRTQIVEGAYMVILEKGLAATATRDVTRQLGVGSGLLHHYFSTWGALRAEVVRTFISKEIAMLENDLAKIPAERLISHFVDWMVSDPDYRFWGLWLDAIEEARRDSDLAEIIEKGYLQWHAAIVGVIKRSVDAGLGVCDNPQNAAWRISALIDGLMGMLALGRTTLSPDVVKSLLQQQIAMELHRYGG